MFRMFVPKKMETRTDVRWMALMDAKEYGLLISSPSQKGLSISALHMPNEDFDITDGLDYSKEHKNAQISASIQLILKSRDLVQLNIDLAQRGLGGDDSWGAKPQDKYQLKSD